MAAGPITTAATSIYWRHGGSYHLPQLYSPPLGEVVLCNLSANVAGQRLFFKNSGVRLYYVDVSLGLKKFLKLNLGTARLRVAGDLLNRYIPNFDVF